MTTERRPTSRLVEVLVGLHREGDRAALAELRRGLGRPAGRALRMARYVEPCIPDEARGWNQERYYLVAALFASHPMHERALEGGRLRDMGWAFRTLSDRRQGERERGNAREPSVERRFTALLSADREELPEHLRHAVSLLRSQGVPLDYDQLLSDLRGWDHPDRWVQRRWARSFWGGGAETSGEGQEGGDDTHTDEVAIDE